MWIKLIQDIQVDLRTNSNQFSEYLSLHDINWYVWQRTGQKSYIARVLDKDRICTVARYRIPLIKDGIP